MRSWRMGVVGVVLRQEGIKKNFGTMGLYPMYGRYEVDVGQRKTSGEMGR